MVMEQEFEAEEEGEMSSDGEEQAGLTAVKREALKEELKALSYEDFKKKCAENKV